jgi:hypothetical protein
MEERMEPAPSHEIKIIPTRRQRHHSYDESVDQAAKLIEDEPTDVEAEIPLERDESIERSNQEDDVPPE